MSYQSVDNGEGKRRNKFAEWHVAWVAEWYNYVECNIWRMTQRTHTHTNKEGAKRDGKAERRRRAVRFTRFLDYGLMFDSRRSFSLKYDLIRPPALISNP